MAKALKTAGMIVAGVALAATGVGALLMPGLAGATTLFGVSMSTLQTVSAGLAAVGGLLDKPKSQGSASPTDWTSNPDQPTPFAFGRVGVAGKIIHRDEFGPDNMYQGIVAVLSGAGPVRGNFSYSGDEQAVTFGANGIAVTSQWEGEMWMQYRLGAQPDVALTSPPGLKNGATLPGWTSAHKLSGKSCYMQTLGENSKISAFGGAEPKPLIEFDGVYGYDPAYDSTYPGGFGDCRLGVRSTYLWIDDPIIAGLNWALGMMENGKVVGGVGASIEAIDVASFVEAANASRANGWKVTAWPDTSEDSAQVLRLLLEAGGAVYARTGGLISCMTRAMPRTSIVTLTARDTAGPFELDTGSSSENRINTVTPSFMSASAGWKIVPANPVSFPAYVAEDGGTESKGLTYRFVPLVTQAAQLAAYDILDPREPFSGTVPIKPHMRRLKKGDCFTISEPGFLLDGVKCLVLGRPEYDTKTGIGRISFRSETDGKHDLALGKTTTLPAYPTLTPVDTTYVSPPSELDWTIVVRPPTAGGGQIPGFDLTGVVSNATATAILIEWGSAATGPWTQAYLGPPTVETVPINGVQPGATYYIAVSYIRDQNTSERMVYGPYTAPTLVADDVSPTSPTIAEINDRYDDLVAAYGDTVAAEASASAAAAAADAAEAARASAVVARDAAGGSATAAAGSASTANTRAGDAASSATAAFNSATTANTVAGAATSSAAAANASQAAASTSATLAARVGTGGGVFANASPSFAGYVQTGGSFPPGTQDWGSGASHTAVAGQVSDKAIRWVVPADVNTGVYSDSTNGAHFKSPLGPGWWVAEALVTLESGSLQGAGALLNTNLTGVTISFAVDPDSTGSVVGAGTAGKTYAFSKLFNLASGTVSANLFHMAAWDGFGARPAKTIIFHLLGVRRATAAEIETGIARSGYSSVSARITSEEATRASETAALAARATTTEALARTIPNKVVNSDGSQGMRTWTGAAWVVGNDPNIGTYFICTAAGDNFNQSDFIAVTPNSTYTLSFEGDGGSNPSANNIYCSGYDAAKSYVEDGLGITDSTGLNWFGRRSTTFTTGSSTYFVRIALKKAAGSSYLALSRFMLVNGSTAVAWTDAATQRDLSARTAITETSVADAQAKLAIARIVLLAEATGGRPARFILQSDSYGGSFAALDAAKIYFGDNSVFDDVSDTLQTVWGTRRRVIAWGAPFGSDNLTEWEGDSSVALSSMSMANSVFWRSGVAPYAGGTAFAVSVPLSVSPSASGAGRNVSGAGNYTTIETVTMTASGGSGSYSYEWFTISKQSDQSFSTNMHPTGTSGATTAFNGTVAAGETISCSAGCLVRDTVTGKSVVGICTGRITENS